MHQLRRTDVKRHKLLTGRRQGQGAYANGDGSTKRAILRGLCDHSCAYSCWDNSKAESAPLGPIASGGPVPLWLLELPDCPLPKVKLPCGREDLADQLEEAADPGPPERLQTTSSPCVALWLLLRPSISAATVVTGPSFLRPTQLGKRATEWEATQSWDVAGVTAGGAQAPLAPPATEVMSGSWLAESRLPGQV